MTVITEANKTKARELTAQLTLDEKIAIVHAAGLFRNGNAERLGIPPLRMDDGPMGVRAELHNDNWAPLYNTRDYVTYLPSGSAVASTWNPDLARMTGEVLGEEARGRGKDVILGPSINIKRSPLCGRNFEYMSEDPVLTAAQGVAYIQGVQESDVAACAKHYAVNSQETDRLDVDETVSERALREIYLPAFEAAVQDGGVLSVMGAYNLVNGTKCCEHKQLLDDILRDEYGFDGFVVSDWSAVRDTKASAEVGMDIELSVTPNFDDYYFANPLKKAVEDGDVKESDVDGKVERVIAVMDALHMLGDAHASRKPGRYATLDHAAKALDIARESIVLLKNDRQILPLQKTGKIAVIGPMGNTRGELFGTWVMLREEAPARSIFEAVKEVVGDRAEVVYAQGSNLTEEPMLLAQTGKNTTPTETLIEQALETAKDADVIVATVGEPSGWSGEARSRSDIGLPECQKALLKALHDTGKPVVVAIMSGRPLTLSWENERFDAILEAWHGGTMAGYALADVLFGDRVPSGKLTATFPQSVGQLPLYYNSLNTGRPYRADFWATTKYLDITNDPVYPFGYGLSVRLQRHPARPGGRFGR